MAVTTAVTHLVELGHRRIARVSGPKRLRHTWIRSEAFMRITSAHGVVGQTVEADYSGESGASATRELLTRDQPPTALLHDNDVMAVSGLTAAQRLGLRVPVDVSIVAWDDSALCELVNPSLTALSRDIPSHGSRAARRLRQAADGAAGGDLQGPAPALALRGSTGPTTSTAGPDLGRRLG